MTARLGLTPAHWLIAALGVVAGSSLASTLAGPGLWLSAGLGAAVALASSAVATRLRLVVTEALALSIALMVAAGAVAVAGVPTPSAYPTFFDGLIGGWADLLSSIPPVAAEGHYLALPYALAWLAATIGFVLLRYSGVPVLPSAGPIGAFGVGLLFSATLRTASLVQGAVLMVLTLALGWYQQGRAHNVVDAQLGNTTVARRRTRVLYGGLVLAATSVVAPVLAPHTPGLAQRARFDLRDRLEPPWDPLDEPSPLARLKSNYVDAIRSDTVFIARGEGIPSRWALATLAAYDGTVWTVGDVALGGSAPFVPIDGVVPPDAQPLATVAAPVPFEVEIVALDGPWLPVPGRPDQLTVASGDPPVAGGTRVNLRTGTVAVPSGAQGLTYSGTASPWPAVADDEMAALDLAAAPVLGLDQQAGAVRDWAADQIEGVAAGWPQVMAVRDGLRAGRYLADDQALPGHSWARLSSFFQGKEFVGNEEQYAAAAAIAVRNAGIDARVVVGYLVDPDRLSGGEVAVTRGDASAWIEVRTAERGWVPVDVTPDRNNVPSEQNDGIRKESVAAPNPPPPPPPPASVETALDQDQEDQPEDEQEADDAGDGPGRLQLAAVVASVPLVPALVAGSWLGAMAALKARRRHRRRHRGDPNQRVFGAWVEANDRLREVGARPAPNLSPQERASALEAELCPSGGLRALAELVDQAAYSPHGIGADDAEVAWQRYEVLAGSVDRSAGRIDRLRRIADPQPFLTRERV